MESLCNNINLMFQFIKPLFLVIHFYYYTLITFLMMLSVIFLTMLMILQSTLSLSRRQQFITTFSLQPLHPAHCLIFLSSIVKYNFPSSPPPYSNGFWGGLYPPIIKGDYELWHLICGNNQSCLLNLNLPYDELQTNNRKRLLISMLEKFNLIFLTSLITLVLLL